MMAEDSTKCYGHSLVPAHNRQCFILKLPCLELGNYFCSTFHLNIQVTWTLKTWTSAPLGSKEALSSLTIKRVVEICVIYKAYILHIWTSRCDKHLFCFWMGSGFRPCPKSDGRVDFQEENQSQLPACLGCTFPHPLIAQVLVAGDMYHMSGRH